MIKNILYIVPVLALALGISCSKDEDTPGTTFDVQASFSFLNTDVWPQRYQIIMGAFGNDTINPLAHTIIALQQENSAVPATLTEVPEEAVTIRVCIANQSGQSVYTLFRYVITGQPEMITIPRNDIRLLTFNRVQAQVFNGCIACHGGSSGSPAAGLNLLSGQSYTNLVNQASTLSSKLRVEPSDLSNSFLVDVMRKAQSTFTHSASNTVAEEDIELVERWIEAGATDD